MANITYEMPWNITLPVVAHVSFFCMVFCTRGNQGVTGENLRNIYTVMLSAEFFLSLNSNSVV